jgi:hypothetical protein
MMMTMTMMIKECERESMVNQQEGGRQKRIMRGKKHQNMLKIYIWRSEYDAGDELFQGTL